jgi:hypothetical protein
MKGHVFSDIKLTTVVTLMGNQNYFIRFQVIAL